MQVGTAASAFKVIFALAVISILIYIAVKKPPVAIGNWSIDGSDDNMLKIIGPDKKTVFAVDILNKGIRVQDYLIKGDEHALQFFAPDLVQMANMRKKQLEIGQLSVVDNTSAENKHDQGLFLYDNRNNKPLAVLNDELLRWPVQDMLVKAAGSQFQVYSKNIAIVNEPKPLSQSARYNVI